MSVDSLNYVCFFFQAEKQNSKIWSKYNQCNILAYVVFENAINYSNSFPTVYT